jgi:hypothetical protein
MVGLQRRLNQLTLDDSASLYGIGAHSGRFQWTTWPTPTSSSTATYLNRGNIDVWVQKMRPDGRTQWVTVFGSSGRDDGRALALHGNGDVVVAGTFVFSASYTNPMQIGRFTLNTATSPAGTATNDVFVARLSEADGSVQWARQFGGAGADEAVAVGVTSAGATVVAGTFTSPSLPLDGVRLTNPGTGSVVFVAYLNSDGVVTSATAYPELNGLSKMAVDPATDAVYLIGTDYVTRLGGGGGGGWTTSLAGISGADRRRGLALDPSSRYVFIGAHHNRGSLTLGGTTLTNAGGGMMDGLVARLDAETGTIDWVVRLAGEDADSVHALVADADSVYVSGAWAVVMACLPRCLLVSLRARLAAYWHVRDLLIPPRSPIPHPIHDPPPIDRPLPLE